MEFKFLLSIMAGVITLVQVVLTMVAHREAFKNEEPFLFNDALEGIYFIKRDGKKFNLFIRTKINGYKVVKNFESVESIEKYIKEIG